MPSRYRCPPPTPRSEEGHGGQARQIAARTKRQRRRPRVSRTTHPTKEIHHVVRALKELAAAGHNFKGANPQQLEAVASLSQEEVTLLNSIKQRLDSAEDVVPHGVDAPLSGAFVW